MDSRSLLTAGRVDGTGGRGSFAGLGDALTAVLKHVRSRLQEPLRLLELCFPSPLCCDNINVDMDHYMDAPIDILVSGIWMPIASLLSERFPGMFSVGIASVLQRCYADVEAFSIGVGEIGVPGNCASGSVSDIWIHRRVINHPAVVAFNKRWGLELYLQVRDFQFQIFLK